MKILKNITRVSAVAACFIGLTATTTSCGDFLEENSQNLIYISKWQDLNELLIGGCYVTVHSTSYFHNFSNKGMFIHLVGDELQENNHVLGGASQFDDHYYTFGYFTWQPRVGTKETFTDFYNENACWTEFYKSINVANNIIESAEKLPENSDDEKYGKAKVAGEAYFVRAFLYWWLTNTYGQPYNKATASNELGVPIKTTSEVIDVKFERNTVQECYDQIVSDLNNADVLLTKIAETPKKSIYRADATAVHLLKSRVYLHMQDWANAEKYARMAMNEHPQLENLNEATNRWFMNAENPENIFSMGGDDICSIINSACQAYRVNDELYNSYSSNDRRKLLWYWNKGIFTGITKHDENPAYPSHLPDDEGYYYFRYSLRSGNQSPVSSLFWLRSAEAYLNLAEALCYQNKDTEAKEVFKSFRKNRFYAGAPEIDMDFSHDDLIHEIRTESRREFAMEGHRWFDLRRYRVCPVMPEKISLTHTYTYYKDRGDNNILYTNQYILEEEDPSWTLPIPAEVLAFNTGMQNNGTVKREFTVVETPL